MGFRRASCIKRICSKVRRGWDIAASMNRKSEIAQSISLFLIL